MTKARPTSRVANDVPGKASKGSFQASKGSCQANLHLCCSGRLQLTLSTTSTRSTKKTAPINNDIDRGPSHAKQTLDREEFLFSAELFLTAPNEMT